MKLGLAFILPMAHFKSRKFKSPLARLNDQRFLKFLQTPVNFSRRIWIQISHHLIKQVIAQILKSRNLDFKHITQVLVNTVLVKALKLVLNFCSMTS